MTTEVSDAFAKIEGSAAQGIHDQIARQFPKSNLLIYPVLVKRDFLKQMGPVKQGSTIKEDFFGSYTTEDSKKEIIELLMGKIKTAITEELDGLLETLLKEYRPFAKDYKLFFANNVEAHGLDAGRTAALQQVNDSILHYLFPEREHMNKISPNKLKRGILKAEDREAYKKYLKTMEDFKLQLAPLGWTISNEAIQKIYQEQVRPLGADAQVDFEAEPPEKRPNVEEYGELRLDDE